MRREQIGEEKQKAKQARAELVKGDDALLASGSKFEDAYQSEDSQDEIMNELAKENEN